MLASLIGVIGTVQGAIEMVDSPTYAGATSQVQTRGTLEYAFTAHNTNRTVNGVLFTQVNANQTSWGGGKVTLSGASGGAATRGTPSAAKVTDSEYRYLLSGLVYDATSPYLLTVTLNNLTSGKMYLIQVWVNDSTTYASTRATKYTISNGTESGEFTLDHSDTDSTAGGVGQFATFKLFAQGTSVTMSLTATGVGTMAAISALQVRWGIPTTQTWIGANGEEWNTSGARWSDAIVSDTLWTPGSLFRALFTNDAVVALSGTLGTDRLIASTNLSLSGSGASLQVGALSVTGALAIAQATLSVKQGLVYRLDASDASSVTLIGGTNRVQSWQSSFGSMVFNVSAVPGYSDAPTYDAAAFGGRGGVVFGNGELYQWPSTRLEASQATNCQTVIFVAKPSTTQSDLAGIWGQSGNDSGVRTSGSASWQGTTAVQIFHGAPGGSHYLNGAAYAYNANAPFTAGQAQVYSSISAATKVSWTQAIGNYWNKEQGTNRFYRGEIAEVLVYDRKLTEEERVTTEAFLAQKWGVTSYSGIALPSIEKLVLTNDATLNLDGSVLTVAEAELGNATVQQGLLIVTNGVRITGALVLDGIHAFVNGALTFEAGTSLTVTNQTSGIVLYQPIHFLETASIHMPVGTIAQLRSDLALPYDGATVPLVVTGGALSMGETSVLTLGLGATVLSAGTNTVIDGYTGEVPVLYPVSTNNLPANGMASLAVMDGDLKLVVEIATVETTLTVSTPETLEYGQPISVTATVRGPDEAIPGGGTISFYKPDELIVPVATIEIDVNGQAVYQSSDRLGVGTGYTYLAKFNGYGQYLYSAQESSAGLAITTRSVNVVSVVATNRLYDATTDAYALATVQAGDILSGDDLTVWAVGDFADAEPGTDKPFTANRAILTGAALSNYTANAFSFEGLGASVVTNAIWNGTAGDYTWTQTHQNWLPGGGLPSQSKPFGPSAGWRNHVTWTNSGQNTIMIKDTLYVGSFAATGLRTATIVNPDFKAVVFPPEGGEVTVPVGNITQNYTWDWIGKSVSFRGTTGGNGHQFKHDNRGVTNLLIYFTGPSPSYLIFNAPYALGGEQTTLTLRGNRDASVSINLGVFDTASSTGFVYSVAHTTLAGAVLRSRVATNTWTSPINVISNSWIGARAANVFMNLDGPITVNEGVTNFFNGANNTCVGVVNLNNTLAGQAEQSFGTLNLLKTNALAQAFFAYNGGTVGWASPGATLYQIGTLNGTASTNLSLPEGLTLELGANDFSGSHAGGLSATGTVRKVGSGVARIQGNSSYETLELTGGTFGTGLGFHTIANLVVQAPMLVSMDVGPEQASGRLVLSQDTDLSAVTLDVWNPGDLSKAADYPVVEFTAGTATALPQVATALKNKGWKVVADESNPNVLELRFLPGTLLLLR
jgi:hypothetical protein